MGKASFSVIAACKTIERPAGLHCDFVCRQFLIQRIFYNDMPIFDFSFPFHSFPVPSFLVLSREQAQQMSTHLPFLACWENPKPFAFSHSISRLKGGFCCVFPLTIYNTALSILPKQRERFLKNEFSQMNSGFPLDKPLRKDYNITVLYSSVI